MLSVKKIVYWEWGEMGGGTDMMFSRKHFMMYDDHHTCMQETVIKQSWK